MNRLEKRSFYSFVTLYIVSSYLFLLVSAYWYYTARKNAIVNETFFKMEHLADRIGGEIIDAHMHRHPLTLRLRYDDMHVALIDSNMTVQYGSMPVAAGMRPFSGMLGEYAVVVSDASRDHLGIARIVIQTDRITKQTALLRRQVAAVAAVAAVLIALIGWILSKLFLRPVRKRMEHIEHFVDSIAHELNTPVSALSLVSQQALQRGRCTPKELRHIAVSTRQLYDIYRSLTFLSFGAPQESPRLLDAERVVRDVLHLYEPHAALKEVTFAIDLSSCYVTMTESEAHLLFSNLVNNAVKYSPRRGKVTLTLHEGRFSIANEGEGIDGEKIAHIFDKFERATTYGGGFGVGLSIVKRICRRYGIVVSVSSKEGVTRFALRFPVSENDQAR